MKKLHFSSNLSVPIEFVTQTQAILAKRRVGKSYTASVQAEEMLSADQQIVIIDITGAWWGLKASADGKGEGFPIVIAGGEHADLPLDVDAGEILADAITTDRFSCIVDLKLLRKGARLKFLASFLETLYLKNRHPLHVFADECDDYVPQTIIRGEDHAARALGAMDDLVRRGGLNGIGCTLISQRPAVVNNNVLTQCEILTLLRLVHPADIKAVMEWVKVKATAAEAKAVLEELPTLPVGTAYFWSPGFPDDAPIGIKRVKIRQRTTFDSGRTPRPGEKVHAPKHLAKPDMQKLGDRIKAVAEEVKANDPKIIKAELIKARQELARIKSAPAASPKTAMSAGENKKQAATIAAMRKGLVMAMSAIEEFEKAAIVDREQIQRIISTAAEQIVKASESRMDRIRRQAKPALEKLRAILNGVPEGALEPLSIPTPARRIEQVQAVSHDADGEDAGELGKMGRAFLIALAQHPKGLSKAQLLILSDYRSSGPTSKMFALLARLGYVTSEANGLRITQAGLDALGTFEPLPVGHALRKHMLERKDAPAMETKFLEILFAAYPDWITKGKMLEISGYASSGPTSKVFAKLVKVGWALASKQGLRASDDFYEPFERGDK